MTLLNTNYSDTFVGNGVTVSFALSFALTRVEDLVVTVEDVLQVRGTDYTVQDLWGPTLGITFLTAPGNSAVVRAERVVTYTQETDIPVGSSYQSEVLERAYDRLVMQIQQLKRRLDTNAPPWQTDTNAGLTPYGLLTGSGIGPYTLSRTNIVAATIRIYVAGQRQRELSFSVTSEANGTFTLAFDPGAASIIVDYQYEPD